MIDKVFPIAPVAMIAAIGLALAACGNTDGERALSGGAIGAAAGAAGTAIAGGSILAGAAIGYLCKHNATLSGAEGGCQSEIGVASAMSAAFIAAAMDASPLVTENAAESALEHHLGMTCDPVAGYVQVPCIERCAFGAVKAWTAYMVATSEIASRHRVDLDTTIKTLADTGKDMSTKYKETSEAGLAANLVLC